MLRPIYTALAAVVLICAGAFAVGSCSSLGWNDPVVVEDPPPDLPPAEEGHVWALVGGVWIEVSEDTLATGTQVVELPNGTRVALPSDSDAPTTGSLISRTIGGILATFTGNPMLAPAFAGVIKVVGDRLAARREDNEPHVVTMTKTEP